MKTFSISVAIATTLATAMTASCLSQDAATTATWNRFRGPNGTGLAENAKLPTTWSNKDFLWKAELEGTGSSSPVVWNNRVFVNSCNSKTAEFFVECRELNTGKQIWKKTYKSTSYRMHSRNSFASSTPAVDDKHVYVTFANPEHTFLIAINLNGEEVWELDFGRWVGAHGYGASPMLYKDMVILVNSQQATQMRGNQKPGKSRVIAVDRDTGEEKWTTDLESTVAAYSVPCLISTDGKTDQLIGCSNAEGFYSIDPNDGKLNWKKSAFKLRTVASPLTAEGLLFGSCGSGGGGNALVAIKPGSEVAESVFEVNQNASYVPCPIAVNGLLFMSSDKGIVSCLDVKSGEVHWRKRVSTGYSSSPVANSNFVYFVDESGNVAVIEAKPKFKLVATNSLGESTRATPAIVGDSIVFRTETHLMAVGTQD